MYGVLTENEGFTHFTTVVSTTITDHDCDCVVYVVADVVKCMACTWGENCM